MRKYDENGPIRSFSKQSMFNLYIQYTFRRLMLSYCFHGRSEFWRGTITLQLAFFAPGIVKKVMLAGGK